MSEPSVPASGSVPFSRPESIATPGFARVGVILSTFAEALARGERPSIESAAAGVGGADRTRLLAELARLDLEARVAAGESARAEDYFRRLPELWTDRELALGLIAAEYAARRRSEPDLSTEEYAARFPDLSTELSTRLGSLSDGVSDGLTRLAPSGLPGSGTDEPTPEGTRTFDPDSVLRARAVEQGWPDVPGYVLLDTLGKGGMGVVYKARDASLGRIVALKMILSGAHAGRDEIDRFKSEMQALARLQHPNVVQIYDNGEHAGRPYCALEFVPGGSLSGKLKAEPQTPDAAARLLVRMARAMHACHEVGVVHRDLKPANVLMTADGEPKITDFGLAKKLDEDSGITREGAVMGTPSYMAPEQAFGDLARIGPATDVYALGVILYEMLTGRVPFKGPNVVETIDQVRHSEPVPPRTLVPKVPRDLETIALKCLQKDPGRRYPTAAALADDVQRFLNHEPIFARPVGAGEKAIKWARRKPALAGLYATGIFTVVGAVATGFYALSAEAKQARVAEAKAEAETKAQTKAREAAESENRRLAQQRETVRTLDSFLNQTDANLSDPSGNLVAARDSITAARKMFSASPVLRDDEKERFERTEKLAELVRVALADKDRYGKGFTPQLTQARLGSQSFTDLEIQTNRVAVVKACKAALEFYGLGDPAKPVGKEALDLIATAPVKPRELAVECFELFLTWADAVDPITRGKAGPAPKDNPELSRQLLDRAGELAKAFGIESRVLHGRRAAYLTRAGDDAAAELAKADAVPKGLALDTYQDGLELYQAGNWKDARTKFKEVAGLRPKDFWPRYLQGLCAIRLGQYEEADQALTEAADQNDKTVWPLLMRGIARRQLKEFALADKDYSNAIKLSTDDLTKFVAFVNRGVSRTGQGRYDDAIADGREALKLNEGAKYLVYNNIAQAEAGKKNLPGAVEAITEAIRLQPGVAALYAQRAAYHLAMADAARADAAKLGGGPDEPGEPRRGPDAADEAAVAKLTATAADEDGKARDDFREAARRAGADARLAAAAQYQLGRLAYRAGDSKASLAAFDAALAAAAAAKQPNPLIHRFRAEPLLRLRRLKEAEAALTEYLKDAKAPTADVFLARGLIAFDLGRPQDAVHNYTLALEASARGLGGQLRARGRGDADARRREGEEFIRTQRGWAYLVLDAARPAEADFQAAAASYSAKESDRLAREQGKGRAADYQAGYAAAFCGLANAHAKLGKLKDALDEVEQALKPGRGDALLYYRSARVFAQVIGQLESSQRASDRALRDQLFQYQARCGELLRKAVETLPADRRAGFWQGTVLADPDLSPVRRSTGFQKLAAALGR